MLQGGFSFPNACRKEQIQKCFQPGMQPARSPSLAGDRKSPNGGENPKNSLQPHTHLAEGHPHGDARRVLREDEEGWDEAGTVAPGSEGAGAPRGAHGDLQGPGTGVNPVLLPSTHHLPPNLYPWRI